MPSTANPTHAPTYPANGIPSDVVSLEGRRADKLTSAIRNGLATFHQDNASAIERFAALPPVTRAAEVNRCAYELYLHFRAAGFGPDDAAEKAGVVVQGFAAMELTAEAQT